MFKWHDIFIMACTIAGVYLSQWISDRLVTNPHRFSCKEKDCSFKIKGSDKEGVSLIADHHRFNVHATPNTKENHMNTSEDGKIEDLGETTKAVTEQTVETTRTETGPDQSQAAERTEETVTETPDKRVTETVTEKPADSDS